MSTLEQGTTTYRGGTLEEVLPRIREQLGPEAVIVRQREGVIGGIGGFFGKRCIEIEARPASVRPSQPPRRVVDAYDTGAPAVAEESALVQKLQGQTSPFAFELSNALAEERPPAAIGTPASTRLGERQIDGPEAMREALLAAGFSGTVADDVLADALRTLQPFAPDEPLRALVQRALSRRIRVAAGWKTRRRTIALIGTPGSGRTLTAAKLCNAYATAGSTVTALSLEPARKALELGRLTEACEVGLAIADTAEAIELPRLRRSEVVVADTPPLDAASPRSFAAVEGLLAGLRPAETHLVMPADADAEAGRLLLQVLSMGLKPSRILVTGADRARAACTPVALSLSSGIPISFVADGPGPATGLHPAEPAELAQMALP